MPGRSSQGRHLNLRGLGPALAATARATIDTWRTFADEGAFAFALDDHDRPTLHGVREDVRVSADLVVDERDVYSRVTAMALTPQPCKVVVRPKKGVAMWIDDVLHRGDDVEIGEAAFDARFLIHATPSDAAVQLLDARVRGLIDAFANHGLNAFGYDHGEVGVLWKGAAQQTLPIDAAITLAVLAARWRAAGAPFR